MSFWGQSNTNTTSHRIIKFCVVIDLKEIYKFWAFQLHTEQKTILNLCYWVCLSHTGMLYINLPENRGMWFECRWVWCTTVWGMLGVLYFNFVSSAHRHCISLHYPTGQHSLGYVIKQIPFWMKIILYVRLQRIDTSTCNSETLQLTNILFISSPTCVWYSISH